MKEGTVQAKYLYIDDIYIIFTYVDWFYVLYLCYTKTHIGNKRIMRVKFEKKKFQSVVAKCIFPCVVSLLLYS